MTDIVIQFEEQAELELNDVDIGVEQDVLAFDVSGTIRGLDDGLLEELAGSSLHPTKVHFAKTDSERQ